MSSQTKHAKLATGNDHHFKVELTLLAVFLLSIRLIVVRGLKQFQIWAWSVMFVFFLFFNSQSGDLQSQN